jgi:hypothetical protein
LLGECRERCENEDRKCPRHILYVYMTRRTPVVRKVR